MPVEGLVVVNVSREERSHIHAAQAQQPLVFVGGTCTNPASEQVRPVAATGIVAKLLGTPPAVTTTDKLQPDIRRNDDVYLIQSRRINLPSVISDCGARAADIHLDWYVREIGRGLILRFISRKQAPARIPRG